MNFSSNARGLLSWILQSGDEEGGGVAGSDPPRESTEAEGESDGVDVSEGEEQETETERYGRDRTTLSHGDP